MIATGTSACRRERLVAGDAHVSVHDVADELRLDTSVGTM